MSKIFLNEKYVIEYIRDTLSDSKNGITVVKDARYHHNTSYNDASSSVKHGILPLSRLNELGIKKYSSKTLEVMDDTESHINGKGSVSLSVAGLTDLYKEEEEYNPFNEQQVDFVITSDLVTRRTTTHYGNEFIFNGDITPDKFRAIDIRLIKLMSSRVGTASISELIQKYNCLRNVALSLKQKKLDVPFREMSFDEGNALDIDQLSKNPILVLKKDI